MYIYIYIYVCIYMCIYIYVCVGFWLRLRFPDFSKVVGSGR